MTETQPRTIELKLTRAQMAALRDVVYATEDFRKLMAEAGRRATEALDPKLASNLTSRFAVTDLQRALEATVKFEATLGVLGLIAPDEPEAWNALDRMARRGEISDWFWNTITDRDSEDGTYAAVIEIHED